MKTKRMSEVKFERELDIFRIEVEIGVRCLSAYLAVNSIALSSEPVNILLNTAPRFWNTNVHALQVSAIMALGRVFDQRSPHNLDKLLKIAQDNLEIFSKEAIGRRKQKQGANLAPSELDDYLRGAYEPTPEDFRNLKNCVKKWRRIYESNYRDMRDKLFAHKEVSDPSKFDALVAKTNIGELQNLFAFLLSFELKLFALFFNGYKPNLSTSAEWTEMEIVEIVKQEAERFLLAAAAVAQLDP